MSIATIWHRKVVYCQRLLLVSLVALLTVSFLTPFAASAQQTDEAVESITLSPTNRKYTIDAGKTINDKMTIVNDGATAYDFTVYARPYSVKDNRYDQPNFTDSTPTADLYKWVRTAQSKYRLEPNASVEVDFSITVPQNAAPGGHYGAIFAEVQPSEQGQSGNQVLRKKRVGMIIYATVNGDVKLAGEAVGSDIPFWQLQPPLRTSVQARNDGNTHFADEVKLTVRDVFGNIKYRAVGEYQVLPNTTRTIAMEWKDASWLGLYKVQVEQKILDKPTSSDGYVLIVPRFIPFVLIIIVVVWGLYAVLRKRKK